MAKLMLRTCLTTTFTLLVALLVTPSAFAVDLIVTTDTQLPAGTYTVDLVHVQAGATLTIASDLGTGTGSTINCQTMIIEEGAALSADAQGWPSAQGPGAGTGGGYRVGGGGGSHGGAGGVGTGLNGSTAAAAASGVTLKKGVMSRARRRR